MTKLQAAERRLWLSLYEQLRAADWRSRGRLIVEAKRKALGMSQDDLWFAYRQAGGKASSTTVQRWMAPEEAAEKGVPDADDLAILVHALARLDLARGRFLSAHLLGDVVRPRFSPQEPRPEWRAA